jgi:hypothetical protein
LRKIFTQGNHDVTRRLNTIYACPSENLGVEHSARLLRWDESWNISFRLGLLLAVLVRSDILCDISFRAALVMDTRHLCRWNWWRDRFLCCRWDAIS